MNQNYFQFNKQIYEQKGIPMGSSTSGIMSEIFLQNMDIEHFHNITRKHEISLLPRYVDDILVL
jgi:Reverse transcriptase (RNA-dependent DNA polymerase).